MAKRSSFLQFAPDSVSFSPSCCGKAELASKRTKDEARLCSGSAPRPKNQHFTSPRKVRWLHSQKGGCKSSATDYIWQDCGPQFNVVSGRAYMRSCPFVHTRRQHTREARLRLQRPCEGNLRWGKGVLLWPFAHNPTLHQHLGVPIVPRPVYAPQSATCKGSNQLMESMANLIQNSIPHRLRTVPKLRITVLLENVVTSSFACQQLLCACNPVSM